MDLNQYALEVRVNGRAIKEYQNQGDVWIEGRKDSEFALRVHNRSSIRMLAVLSVDGLSAIGGKEASSDDSGYIIDPHTWMDVPGWRLSNEEIAKFIFSKSGGSYAAKMDKPRNIGVIGCSVFQEKQPIFHAILRSTSQLNPGGGGFNPGGGGGPVYGSAGVPYQQDSFTVNSVDAGEEKTTASVYSAKASLSTTKGMAEGVQTSSPSLGTGFGKKETHRVREVTFERASNTPDESFAIRYGDREELKRRGVDLVQKPSVAHKPDAFPGDKFCSPPADWSGR